MGFRRIRSSVSLRATLVAIGVLAGLVGAAAACGPFFPNTVLDAPDRTVLAVPHIDFFKEIDRLMPAAAPARKPAPAGASAVSADDTDWRPALLTSDADIGDLKKVLNDLRVAPEAAKGLVEKYTTFRSGLAAAIESVDRFSWDEVARPQLAMATAGMAVPAGLPAEFASYSAGALAFHQGKPDEARKHWQAVLDLPKDQRRYRSVWAAYMMGRSWVDKDPKAAADWLKKTRDLAKDGFADSLDLTTASLGWEGRTELDQKNYGGAIKLYLAQYARNGFASGTSLRDAACEVFRAGPEALKALASDAEVRPVLSAFVVARGGPFGGWDDSSNVWARDWLVAVEAARVVKIEGADRLAWAAYLAGDWQRTAQWLKLAAPESPVTQWVQAKLMLRDGKLDKAAELLAGLVRSLPQRKDPDVLIWNDLEESPMEVTSPIRTMAGELAVLDMARRQYVDALDLLMQFDYWPDAAYVADRVLTIEELIAYVDKHWPSRMAEKWKPGQASPSGTSGWPADRMARGNGFEEKAPELEKNHVPEKQAIDVLKAHDIRHLLARRLVRLGRYKLAGVYFPPNLQEKLDAYVKGLEDGANVNLAAEKRAAGYWAAAKLAREWGLALMGTELAPDGVIHEGDYGYEGPDKDLAAGNQMSAERLAGEDKVAPPTEDERKRFARNIADPDKRFHYRYVAADHAWAAIGLMPDNADETARRCVEAGGWLKARDPQAALRFYKVLVGRCDQTALGREAAETHWFPRRLPAAKE
jgi:hypothetical protein